MKKIIVLKIIFNSIFLKADVNEILSGTNNEICIKLLERVFENIGDLEKIDNVRLSNTTQQQLNGSDLTFPNVVTIVFPNEIQIDFGNNRYIIKGKNGWVKYKKGYYEKLPTTFCEKLCKPLKQNIFYLGKRYKKLSLSYVEEKKSDSIYYIVRINDYEYDLYINTETFLIDQIHYTDETGNIVKKIESYKQYGEYLYPDEIITHLEDGTFISKIIVESVEFNIDVQDDGL